jgi:alpha-mannosidase II
MVSTGQIEIAGGGWVMNDEAAAHYDSIINQMACGHEWVYQNLGVYPNTSYGSGFCFGALLFVFVLTFSAIGVPKVVHRSIWTLNDNASSFVTRRLSNCSYRQVRRRFVLPTHSGPHFGRSFCRAHYAFKKNLAWNKALEFRWRQEWQGEESNTDMITHMFPFFIYDLAHTCGPDPKICSRYEFGKAGRSTLWHDPIKLTTESNIGQMSTDYADQIKKKATLFRTGKTVMIPLGQDFMYDTEQEMDAMLTHHEAIHKYINGRPEMGMNIRFGTLSDYWASVKNSVAKGKTLLAFNWQF